MFITVSYHVDKALYFSSDRKHFIEISTTEYTYGNEMLVHLQYGKNFGIRLNNLLRYEFKKDKDFQNEQFFFKKVYSGGKPKPTTQSTFDKKLSRFDMGQTVVEQEILEGYSYTDKNGHSASVQIVVREKNGGITAAIDFKDLDQFNHFICPAWLTLMGDE